MHRRLTHNGESNGKDTGTEIAEFRNTLPVMQDLQGIHNYLIWSKSSVPQGWRGTGGRRTP